MNGSETFRTNLLGLDSDEVTSLEQLNFTFFGDGPVPLRPRSVRYGRHRSTVQRGGKDRVILRHHLPNQPVDDGFPTVPGH